MTLATIANPGDARKATPAQNWARALETIGLATRDPDRILTRAIADWASRYGDAPALLSDREAFSFRALEARMKSVLALGSEREGRARRDRRSRDGQSPRVFRDLARLDPGRRDRRAPQPKSSGSAARSCFDSRARAA